MDEYLQTRTLRHLDSAWRKIRENAYKSTSETTRREVREFEPQAQRKLKRIQDELRNERFEFQPAKGIPIRRPGKSARPIVKSPIENRIVQRSILDVLQALPTVKPFFDNPTSFGGVKGDGRGVAGAIRAAQGAFGHGQVHFVRSDISQFFTRIPRERVVAKFRELIDNTRFCNLLEQALTTELTNMADLGKEAELFPIHEIGVAQGCCLSPLVGNILLCDFDKQLNGRGVTTIRYIDDFLILATSPSRAHATFTSAQQILEELGLTSYDPRTSPDKAQEGKLSDGLGFLGCHLAPGHVAPSHDALDRLKAKVEKLLASGVRALHDPANARRHRSSLVETLRAMDLVLHGWGNQYSFCTDRRLFADLDAWIDVRLSRYFTTYGETRRKLVNFNAVQNSRRLLGVHWVQDSKQDARVK